MYSTLLGANIHPYTDNSQKNSYDSTDECYSHPKYSEQMYESTIKMFLRWQGFFGDLSSIATSVCLTLRRQNNKMLICESCMRKWVFKCWYLQHFTTKLQRLHLSSHSHKNFCNSKHAPLLYTLSTPFLFQSKRKIPSSEGAKLEDTPVQICLTSNAMVEAMWESAAATKNTRANAWMLHLDKMR